MKKVILTITLIGGLFFVFYVLFLLSFIYKPFKYDVNKLNDLTVSEIYKIHGNPIHDVQVKGFQTWEFANSNLIQTLRINTNSENINYLQQKPTMIVIKKLYDLNGTTYVSLSQILVDQQIKCTLKIWPFKELVLSSKVFNSNGSNKCKF
ncbi:hypothetical protein [Thorsellia kenyensis]|uniref:Uncharacterized protein n=1 Tax=Thorsellia kenyensis TaxID=1549888 RepID=A0ABV6CAC2_9GAMM